MKKTIAFFLVLAMLLGCTLSLSSCSERVSYDNGDAYEAGAFALDTQIYSVEIYWDGDAVSVSGAYVDRVKAEENYEEEDDCAMRYLLEGGVLKIYPCASGARLGKLKKSLFLEIPMDMANSLTSLTVHAANDTDVNIMLVEAEELLVVAEDGDVDFEGTLMNAQIETVKGDLTAKSPTLSNLDFRSITGDAKLSLHLQGFTAMMINSDGKFESDYEVTENENIYSYGTMETVMLFETEGNVSVREYKLGK